MNFATVAKHAFLVLTASCFMALATADTGVSETIYNQGFAMPRLNALTAAIDEDVRGARLPGAVILVARNGNLVYAETAGLQDPATRATMKRDTIFRLYSMTKPLVSVAAMMMVEEGKIFLADPVSKHLPELANLKVGIERTDSRGMQTLEVVPTKREITIQDLLRHTAGFTYGFEGKSLVKDEYKKNGIDGADQPSAEWVGKLAKLPLQSQPGSKWEYSIATDVLGVLLERVSGQSLDVLLTERIFRPLGMKDTAFFVETAKQNRIAEPFEIDPIWKTKVILSDVRKPPARYSGGGGAVSTADDYLRFAQFCLTGAHSMACASFHRKLSTTCWPITSRACAQQCRQALQHRGRGRVMDSGWASPFDMKLAKRIRSAQSASLTGTGSVAQISGSTPGKNWP